MAQNVALPARSTHQNVETVDRSAAAVAPTITTTALPDGSVGVAYSQTIQRTGTDPITFAVQSGDDPATIGLSFSSAGVLSGAPTAPAALSFTIRATNSTGYDDQALTLLVPNEGVGGAAPTVTTVTLVPTNQSVAEGATVDLVCTVEDESGSPMPNMDGTLSSSDTNVATVEQIAPTDANGVATVRVTGVNSGIALVRVSFDGVASNDAAVEVQTVETTGTLAVASDAIDTFVMPVLGLKHVKVLCHYSAAGATGITAEVFEAPAAGELTGARLGVVHDVRAESALEAGQAVIYLYAEPAGVAGLSAGTLVRVVFHGTTSVDSPLGNQLAFGSVGVHTAIVIEG